MSETIKPVFGLSMLGGLASTALYPVAQGIGQALWQEGNTTQYPELPGEETKLFQQTKLAEAQLRELEAKIAWWEDNGVWIYVAAGLAGFGVRRSRG